MMPSSFFRSPRALKLLFMVLIAVAVVLVYFRTPGGSFHLDDDKYPIVNNEFIKDGQHFHKFFTRPWVDSHHHYDGTYRPIPMMTFALNYALGGLKPSGYHLVDIAIHLLNALLFFSICFLLLRRLYPGSEKSAYLMAGFAALLFAVHPINSLSVNFIWKRTGTLAALFCLAGLRVFISGRQAGEKDGGGFAWPYLFALIPLFIAGLMCKELSAALPLALLLVDFLVYCRGDFKKIWKPIKQVHLPMLLLMVAFIVLWFLWIRGSVPASRTHGDDSFTRLSYLLTQFRVHILYIGLSILPGYLSFEHELISSTNVGDGGVITALITLSLIIGTALVLYRRKPLITLGILWFFLWLVPSSSFLPLYSPADEHRVYLSSAGYAWVLLALMHSLYNLWLRHRSRSWQRAACVVPVIVILTYGLVTFIRSAVWLNDHTLMEDLVDKYPNSFQGNFVLATMAEDRGRKLKGQRQIEQFKMALKYYNRLLQYHPKSHGALNNRGMILARLGRYPEALKTFQHAVRLQPRHPSMRMNLAKIYLKLGKRVEAERELRKVLILKPDHPDLHRMLKLMKRGG